MTSWDAIFKRACFTLRDGHSINPWTDLWIFWLKEKKPTLKEGVNESLWSRVANLQNGDDGRWNVHLLEQIYETNMVEAICKVPWLKVSYKDKLVWTNDKQNRFLVKSYYLNTNHHHFDSQAFVIWTKL